MPLTLWRHIFVEVGRLVALSTAVLVTVIAFAATVKPLADGQLSAPDAVRFMLYAVPPMLAYALPFAAGFGATLAYHRFAQDNEAIAAFAGGLSHGRLLAPALGMGLALSGALMLLNDQVIPRFLTRMESMITRDVAQLMIRSLEQGQSARFGDVEIHADTVTRKRPEKGSPYTDQILLTGVAAIELLEDASVGSEVTASQAWVLIFPASELPEEDRGYAAEDDLLIMINFQDAAGRKRGEGSGVSESYTTPPVPLPDAFKDDPKFLTGGQLRRLRAHPERMNWINEQRLQLARDLAKATTIRTLRERVRDVESMQFRTNAGRDLRVRASHLAWEREFGRWRLEPPTGADRVEVESYLPDGTVERVAARRAFLAPEPVDAPDPFATEVDGSLAFELVLEDVVLRSGPSGALTGNEIPRQAFARLSTPGDPFHELRRLSSSELIAEARARAEGDEERLTDAAQRLEADVRRLGREITSKQHERLALAASCAVMVLVGAVMALRLRDAMPLVVYLWSFFPALGTIVLISSGQQTTHRDGLIGLPILWGAVVALGAFALAMFARLRRH